MLLKPGERFQQDWTEIQSEGFPELEWDGLCHVPNTKASLKFFGSKSTLVC